MPFNDDITHCHPLSPMIIINLNLITSDQHLYAGHLPSGSPWALLGCCCSGEGAAQGGGGGGGGHPHLVLQVGDGPPTSSSIQLSIYVVGGERHYSSNI